MLDTPGIIDELRNMGLPATAENIERLQSELDAAKAKVELETKLTPGYIMTVLNQHLNGLTINEILSFLSLPESEVTRRKLGVVLEVLKDQGIITRENINNELRNIPCREG